MKKILYTAAFVLAAAPVFAQVKIDRTQQPKPGPAPVIRFDDPSITKLPNGLTLVVVENHKMPKVTASFSIDAGPIEEGKKAGVTSLMGAMLNEGTKTKSKDKFDEAVEMMGANVSLSSGGGYISSLSRYFPQAFALFADALRNPAFNKENFEKLQAQTLTGLKTEEKSATAIAGKMENALNYGKNTAFGEFQTEESIKSISLDDVKQAYKNYITPSRGYLTIVGDITPAQAKAIVTKNLGDWKGRSLKLPTFPTYPLVGKTEVNFVDVPNAVQSEIIVGNLVTNPKNNPDIYALNLANQILGGGSDGKLFMNLREKRGFTYGSYSSIGSGRYQDLFTASAQVRNEKADSAVGEILSEINNMRNGNISDEELMIAKAKYNGSFALSMENPRTTATYANNILIYNLPKDYYKTYLQKINAVTKADIQRVANKYFSTSQSRIIVVGKAEAVVPNLEKAGYSVTMYDRFGDKVVAKAEDKVSVPADMTGDKVIAKFIEVSGGAAAINAVKTMSADIEMEMMGQKLGGVWKQAYPGKSLMEIQFQGATAFKTVSDGKTGYMSQMGQKTDLSADELKEMQKLTSVVPQANYAANGIKAEMAGTSKVQDENAYKLKITDKDGDVSYEYYSVKTGFLLKDEKTKEIQGQKIDQINEYSNYVKVGNVYIPGKMVQNMAGQEIPLEFKNIKLNEGVTDADFK